MIWRITQILLKSAHTCRSWAAMGARQLYSWRLKLLSTPAMLTTSSTKWCGFSQGVYAFAEKTNSFCAGFHVRSASVLRNNVGIQLGMLLCPWQSLGLYFGLRRWVHIGGRNLPGSPLRGYRWLRMRTVPHFDQLEVFSVEGFTMLIVSWWSYCKNVWDTCFEQDLCHAVLWVNFANIQNLHGLWSMCIFSI